MEPFESHTGVGVPLRRSNVDTDQIIPAVYLKSVSRTGFAGGLFAAWRSDPDFVLNLAPYQAGSVLVAGPDFGTGSSREHAVWALAEYGFRAILAPSFADIFTANCCQNGVASVRLSGDEIDELVRRCQAGRGGYRLTVDLEAQRVIDLEGMSAAFSMEPYRRDMLLRGLDEIGRTLAEEPRIAAFETGRDGGRAKGDGW